MSEKPSRIGFGGTYIQVGDIVRIRLGFGAHAYGRVDKLPSTPVGDCDVTLTKVGKTRAGWIPGNRVEICSVWLEGPNHL